MNAVKDINVQARKDVQEKLAHVEDINQVQQQQTVTQLAPQANTRAPVPQAVLIALKLNGLMLTHVHVIHAQLDIGVTEEEQAV